MSFNVLELMTKNEEHIFLFLHHWTLAVIILETTIITHSISLELGMDLLLEIKCL